jgi:hypothetical protein
MTNEVAAAAKATLASGAARVRHRWFFEPATPRFDRFLSTQEGVTDFARRRTRIERHVGPSVVDDLATRMIERYPWLEDDEEDREPSAIVLAGTASYFGGPGRWKAHPDGDVHARERSRMDPAWIVEVLERADEVTARGEDVVRDVPCRQWEFRVDLGDGSARLAGDAWIDEERRLRRVTCTRLYRRRPRMPRKSSETPRLWQTTELWDFGVSVEIEVPDVEPSKPSSPAPLALAELAWKFWWRKRAYARRHPRP